jgi:uncharacterized protein (DUF1697 family)
MLMITYVALLRAVNVGGTGAISMRVLVGLCSDLGFLDVRTYIQSGNIVFKCQLSEEKVRTKLENALERVTGKRIDVLVRTGSELKSILAANPFPQANPSKVGVLFLSKVPPAKVINEISIPGREEVRVVGREALVYYPDGMGRSRLKLTILGTGTVRNLNTVGKLVAMTESTQH